MAHLIFLVDGMPEGIEYLEQNLDRRSFGKGKPCRLREIKLYDLQYDSKDRKEVMNEFHFPVTEHKFKDRMAYSFRYKEAPFKHGKFRRAIALFLKLFGWPFGIKPLETWKEVKTPTPQKVAKPLMNVIPIADIQDNFTINRVHGMEEEWL